ncbi:VPS33A, partial [Cordylochernes scorpioides]
MGVVVQERGVKGNFQNLDEFNLELYPFDSDVLSMEISPAFKVMIYHGISKKKVAPIPSISVYLALCKVKSCVPQECFVEEDFTCLFDVAKALMKIQSLYGIIPNVYGKGEAAKHVFELMTRLRREQVGQECQMQTPQIHSLILLDRTVDLMTPLVTQLTYEGLLDEIYGIDNNIIKLPPEKFVTTGDNTAAVSTETKILNSAEELYSQLRDLNFSQAGGFINRKMKQLSSQFKERHEATTVQEMKQFVNKLPRMQDAKKSLATHTSIAELVNEVTVKEEFHSHLEAEHNFIQGIDTDKVSTYIEDMIAQEEPFIKGGVQVLRLICIQSLANNGLKPKVLEHYRREILQVYGYQHLLFLTNLERCGLLRPAGPGRVFSTFRSTLRLYVEEVGPVDMASVCSGYAPLSVRLVQFLHSPGWRAIADVLAMLPGPTIEEVQTSTPTSGTHHRRNSSVSSTGHGDEQKVALVFFIGGCTFSEISALRFLSQQED